MSAQGRGIPQDLVAAHMWISLAQSSGERPAHAKALDAVADLMTPSQIAQARLLARARTPKTEP